MKKTIQTIAIVLATTVSFLACTKEKEAFKATVNFGSKKFDGHTSDYPTGDTAIHQITKKGTNYTGQSTIGDTATATRTN